MVRHLCAALLLLSSSGCSAGWQRLPGVCPGQLSTRQQAQIWSTGESHRWHAIRVTRDSITGVPFFQSSDCDSCRVALPLATVDSVRTGNPVAGFWRSVGVAVAGALGLIMVVCGSAGCVTGN